MVEDKLISVEKSSTKISFGVKRKEESKVINVTKTVIEAELDSDEEREKEELVSQSKRRKLTHFEDGGIIGDEEKGAELSVIPMVVEHDWRTMKLLEKEKEGTLTVEEKAKLELLNLNASQENGESNEARITVDEESNRKETEDADYSAIPIESFGLAILRGCNWKDGDGIGKNPKKVALRLPERRPHGLGLGATPRKNVAGEKKDAKNGTAEEIGEIKAGSCIKIVDGRNKGLYGKVEARDDDTNSLFVRLAVGNKSVKVSEYVVVGVTKKEYERDSKCLNKAEYDKVKEKMESINESAHEMKPSSSKSTRREEATAEDDRELWVRTDLLVRFIDPDYKDGRLYNKKVGVVDVASRKDVTIEDDRGKIYYNIRQSMLETVIPKVIGEKVMIVGGKRKGRLAIMIDKDKRKEKVTLKLVASSEELRVYFEDVCAVRMTNDDDYE